MPKNLSAKFYKENTERLQKDIKIFLKNRKKVTISSRRIQKSLRRQKTKAC